MWRRPRQAVDGRHPAVTRSPTGKPQRLAHAVAKPAASGSGDQPCQAAFPVTRETSDLQDPAGPGASRRSRTTRSRRISEIPVSRGTSSLRCPAGPLTSPAGCGAGRFKSC